MKTIIEKTRRMFAPRKGKECLPDYMIAEIQGIIRHNSSPVSLSTPLDKLGFAVMDVETTGFNYKKGDEIIAIGAVIVEDGEIKREKTFHQLVYPNRQVPDPVSRLTGIAGDMLVGRPSFFGVLQQFLGFIGCNIIIGHNIPFDLGFINPKLKKYCRTEIKNRAIDTLDIARFLDLPSKSVSLDNLLDFYGIEPVGRHSALGDALLTAELFIRLAAALKDRHIHTLAELDSLIKQRARFGDNRIF
jgi:DNA polymerase-3 subunit epsilon